MGGLQHRMMPAPCREDAGPARVGLAGVHADTLLPDRGSIEAFVQHTSTILPDLLAGRIIAFA
jgi:hypothetical protein